MCGVTDEVHECAIKLGLISHPINLCPVEILTFINKQNRASDLALIQLRPFHFDIMAAQVLALYKVPQHAGHIGIK